MNETRLPHPWAGGVAPPPLPRPVRLRVATVSPVVTYVLLGLTVFVFLGQLGTQLLLGRDYALLLGAKVNSAIAQGQWWRLVTPIFLHAGLLHIGFNMYALYVIGPEVEGPLGHARFLFLYMHAGVAGVLLSLVMSAKPSVGASGAIFGLVAAQAVYLYRHRDAFGELGRRRFMNIVMVMLINLAIGASAAQIDNWGHLGGLLGGAGVAWALGPRLTVVTDPVTGGLRVADKTTPVQRWIAAILLGTGLLAVAAFAVWTQ